MVICDINNEDTNEPVEVAPRQILKRRSSVARPTRGSWSKTGSEPSLTRSRTRTQRPRERKYQTCGRASTYIMDYHMLQTTSARVDHPAGPQRDARRRGIPVEFSKGEFGKGQHEINITYKRRAVQRGQPRALLQAWRQGRSARERRRRLVHGEVDDG